MHIMCMHMAMAVMRIAFNIMSCFYLTRPRIVKRPATKIDFPARPLEFFPNLPIISPETFS
jgi:hypothetical protein